MVNDDRQQVIATAFEKVMEKEKNSRGDIQLVIVICKESLYSRSNTKLAEINAPIIIPRKLTTLLSTIDIPLS
jgi:hypothetical protein